MQANGRSAIIRIEVLECSNANELMVSMQGCYYDAGGEMQQYDAKKAAGKNKVYEKQTLLGAIANANKLRSQGAEFQLVTIRSKL